MIGGNLFYFLIRRENGLNDRLKLVKNGRKEIEIERNKNESQETRNELKVSDLETYPLKNEERWITEENLHGFAYGNISECYGSTSTWIFFTETIFFTQNSLNTSPGGSRTLRTAPFSLFIGKKGSRLPPSSPRRAGLLPPEAFQLQKYSRRPNFKISKLLFANPIFYKFTPLLS